MSHTKSLVVLAGAALGLSSVALAQQSADETRAAARELKSDAVSRSSFIDEEGTPGMEFGGYTQFQYRLNHRDDVGKETPDDDDDDDFANGFRFQATKLMAHGDITEEWSYKFQGRFNTGDGGFFNLDDMIGWYTVDNGWKFGFGQAKLPFLAEELVNDTGQLAAGRGIINDDFSIGRGQGVFVNYEQEETWRFMGAFSDGAGTANTEFTDNTEADWAATGRVEWMWAGEWSRFDDNTSFQGQENAGRVGGAFHYQDGGETFATSDTTIWGATGDVTVEGNGWNLQGAAVYSQIEPTEGDSVTDLGLQVQGGIFLSDVWELFGRANYIIPDDNDVDGNPFNGDQERGDFTTYTIGANHYLTPQSHNAKLTFQVLYSPDEQTNKDTGVTNFGPSNSAGILNSNESGQWVATAQLQLIF